MSGLEGAGALVTGGGSGIGLACAKRLAADGAAVTVCGRTEAKLQDAVEELNAIAAPDARARYSVADVTDEQQVADAAGKASEATGTLDVAIACAGGTTSAGPIGQLDAAAWRATLELNVTGTMFALKHCSQRMAQGRHGGSFVAISSIASSNTHRWFGAYGVSKAGVDHLVALGADELGAAGIRVNGVRPGLVATELVSGMTQPGPVLDDYLECMPLARVGQVEDIAATVRFLAGPESGWVTGQVINVDGGHHLRRGPNYRAVFEPLFGGEALDGGAAGTS